MVSVTPEITASASFQTAAQRSNKSDASPDNDRFASLVDSNAAAAANNNDRGQDQVREQAPPPASTQSAPPRRADDSAADDRPVRGNGRSDKPARNDAPDRDVAADQPATDAKAQPDQAKRTKPKTTAKGEDTKEAAKQPADDSTTSESTDTEVTQATTVTIEAVATAIAVAAAPTDVPAPAASVNSASSGSAAPLAIAAAALAASTAISADATATAKPDQADASAAATPAVTAAVATDAKAETSTAQTAATEAIAAAGKATVTDGAATASTVAKTAVAAAVTTPVAPKAATKTASATGEADALATGTDAAATLTDASATEATTAAAPASDAPHVAKPAASSGAVEAAKHDASPAGPATAAAAHLNAAVIDTAPGQAGAPTNNVPAAGAIQMPQQASSSQAQPQLTVTAATQSQAVPLSGLAMEIAASARSGKSRFEIRLDPADLGRIDVRIDVDRNGQVTSHLTVEKPETLSMLRQDAPQLQRALNDAGLSTGNGGLQFSLRDQSSSGQNNDQSNPNAHRLIVAEDETVPAAMANNYGRMLSASGGVDIRV